jgi:hypothetical protein
MTKQFSFDPGQECWLLFRTAADPPAQVWMVCKKTERKIQVAPGPSAHRPDFLTPPERGEGRGEGI